MSVGPTIYDNAEHLIAKLVEQFIALSHLGRPVHISLSGGSTPERLFRALAQPEHATQVQWENLHLWWGDERCVAPDDAQSNYGMTKTLLLDEVAIPSENVHRIRGEAEPQTEAQRFADEMLAVIPTDDGIPAFDWILLGIGGDGHTASLFPEQTNYDEPALAVIAHHPESGQVRVSKSARLLNAAHRVSYLALGRSKADILQQIMTRPASELPYPAAHIGSQKGITEYLIDAEAASLIAEEE